MKENSDQKFTEVGIYLQLCLMQLFYNYLSSDGQQQFLDSLNQNPIRHIVKDEDLKFSNIFNFYAYKHYFVYKPSHQMEKVYFVDKRDVAKALRNTKQLLENSYKSFDSYRLN